KNSSAIARDLWDQIRADLFNEQPQNQLEPNQGNCASSSLDNLLKMVEQSQNVGGDSSNNSSVPVPGGDDSNNANNAGDPNSGLPNDGSSNALANPLAQPMSFAIEDLQDAETAIGRGNLAQAMSSVQNALEELAPQHSQQRGYQLNIADISNRVEQSMNGMGN